MVNTHREKTQAGGDAMDGEKEKKKSFQGGHINLRRARWGWAGKKTCMLTIVGGGMAGGGGGYLDRTVIKSNGRKQGGVGECLEDLSQRRNKKKMGVDGAGIEWQPLDATEKVFEKTEGAGGLDYSSPRKK